MGSLSSSSSNPFSNSPSNHSPSNNGPSNNGPSNNGLSNNGLSSCRSSGQCRRPHRRLYSNLCVIDRYNHGHFYHHLHHCKAIIKARSEYLCKAPYAALYRVLCAALCKVLCSPLYKALGEATCKAHLMVRSVREAECQHCHNYPPEEEVQVQCQDLRGAEMAMFVVAAVDGGNSLAVATMCLQTTSSAWITTEVA